MSKGQLQAATWLISQRMIEGLEERKLLAQGKVDPAAIHTPGICPCAGCQSQKNTGPTLTDFLKTNPAASAPVGAPLSDVPILHSRPGLTRRLFIDFNSAPAFDWTNTDGNIQRAKGPGGTNDPIPAFSIDANLTDFNNNELAAIQEIWRHVSEKYSIFDVDVTTEDPGVYADGATARVIVGGSNSDWTGSGGGVASINGFNVANRDNTSFVWSADSIDAGSTTINFGDRHFIGETIAHEAGHTFGLVHQRKGNGVMITNEYYDGDASRAPIMGNSSNMNLKYGRWWVTNWESGQQSTDNTQDDRTFLGGILGNRGDDWINHNEGTPSYASTDNQGHWSATGVINSFLDQDTFRFNASGPSASFTMTNAAEGAMLKPRLEIRTWPGKALVATSNSSGNNTYTVSAANLTIGNVYIVVASSDFTTGSMGQFSLAGTVQSFASLSNGVLTVNGFAGVNDDIQFDLYFLEPTKLYVDDAINGDPGQVAAFLFNWSDVDSIVINTGTGNDNVRFLRSLPLAETTIDMGTGSDTLACYGYNTGETFSISATGVDWGYQTITFANGNGSIETTYALGYQGDDVFYVSSWNYGTLAIYGGEHNDTVSVSSGVIESSGGAVQFFGENGSDTYILNDSTNTSGKSFSVGFDRVQVINSGQVKDFSHQTVELLRILGGSGDDSFGIDTVSPGVTVQPEGGDGSDSVGVGYSDPFFPFAYSSYIQGTVYFIAGPGDDSLSVDDRDYGSVGNYSIGSFFIDNSFTSGGFVFWDPSSEHIDFYGRNNGHTVTAAVDVNQDIEMHGGTGLDTLIIDERTLYALGVAPRLRLDKDRLYHVRGTVENSFGYDGFESLTLYSNDYTNTVDVAGYPPNIANGYQVTVITGVRADVVNVYPHDANGDAIILKPLGVIGGGGTDQLIIDDTNNPADVSYDFQNPFGSSTQNIYGMGPGVFGAGNTFESIVINAGSGNDSFNMNGYSSGIGLTLNGYDGDDTLNMGSGSINSQITNISALHFAGMNGYDTLNANNGTTNGTFSYTRNPGWLICSSSSPSYYLQTSESDTEMIRINDGAQAGILYANAVPSGSAIEFNGGAAVDGMYFGSSSTNNLDSIQGPVTFNGETAGGNIAVLDSADSSGDIVHLTSTSLGALPGDTLCGPSGALYFSGLANFGVNPGITLNLGSGEDTVYATPLAEARVTVNGNNPAAVPGDFIGLALAGVENPNFTPGVTGWGTWNSTNRQALNYTGFESTDSDATAPEVIAQDFALAAAGPMAVQAQFNEAVALDNAYLTLTNVDDSSLIPTGDIFYSFDTGTNTANFTFDNYQYGALPDGNYHASIPPVMDAYGNAASAGVELDVFFLQGDGTRDRKVNTEDFNVLAGNFGAGATFGEGDFSFDGSTDSVDFNIFVAQYGKTLPAPAPSATVLFSPQAIDDGVREEG